MAAATCALPVQRARRSNPLSTWLCVAHAFGEAAANAEAEQQTQDIGEGQGVMLKLPLKAAAEVVLAVKASAVASGGPSDFCCPARHLALVGDGDDVDNLVPASVTCKLSVNASRLVEWTAHSVPMLRRLRWCSSPVVTRVAHHRRRRSRSSSSMALGAQMRTISTARGRESERAREREIK